MLYDEHYRLGIEHARAGLMRYHWSDPHLQAAYDRGYDRASSEKYLNEYLRRTQTISGRFSLQFRGASP